MSLKTCQDCRFYLQGEVEEIGECRRFPPFEQEGFYYGHWPRVRQHGIGCGEFKEIATDPTKPPPTSKPSSGMNMAMEDNMTNTQQNRDLLATKVMGWKLTTRSGWYGTAIKCWRTTQTENGFIDYDDWNPYERGDHCFMLLDRLDALGFMDKLEKMDLNLFCYFIGDLIKFPIESGEGPNRKTAICTAILALLEQMPEVFDVNS